MRSLKAWGLIGLITALAATPLYAESSPNSCSFSAFSGSTDEAAVPNYCARVPMLNWQSCADGLLKTLGPGFEGTQLAITKQGDMNAFAIGPDRIVISEAMLEVVESQEELAFLIAHELGHLAARQARDSCADGCGSESSQSLFNQELSADAFARSLLTVHQLTPKAGQHLLRRLHDRLSLDRPWLKQATLQGIAQRIQYFQ